MKKGFTLVEMMIVVAVVGAIAALSIPAIYGAYSGASARACSRNIVEVEKAKMQLTLPPGIVAGAMGLDNADQDLSSGSAYSNLLSAMNISDLSVLRVGDLDIHAGTLKIKAWYE